MKLRNFLAMILTGSLFFGMATLANADDPLQNEGDFEPMPIRAGKLVADPVTGQMIQVELADESASPTIQAASAIKQDSLAAASPNLAESEGESLTHIAAGAISPHDLLSANPESIGPMASTLIRFDDFETGFPAAWVRTGTQQWGDVNCSAVSGTHAVWPAANVVNPCSPTNNNYPANTNAWMTFGPFSLADAKSAMLNFYFRLDSESDGVCNPTSNCDYLFWGASTNGSQFYGNFTAGTHTGGPFVNGYNFVSFDLNNVTTLGNLSGKSQVWIRFAFVSNNNGITGAGPFLDFISLRKNTDTRVYLLNENFETTEFPNSTWEIFDLDGIANGELFWDDVQLGQGGGFSCPARSGSWSMWPANEGANALNPCIGANYADNMNSWMIYGPFSLAGASEAWLDFSFRSQLQSGDFLFWGASINGNNFFGPVNLSGTQTTGPYPNGYNLMRLDFSNVFTLGDLRGQPNVWIGFLFHSNNDFITDKGPFIDDISIVVEKAAGQQTFLPLVLKSPPPVLPKTNLFINNKTGGIIANYKVFKPKLNGVIIPDIVCANIPAGVTNFNCNTSFDTGIYKVSSTNTCNPPTSSGQVTFKAGNDVRLVRCLD